MAVLLGQRPGVPVRAPGRVRKHPAPVWIRAFTVVAATAALSVALALAALAGAVRDDLTELGDRTVPQVAATENLAAALSDMDTQLANGLLAGDDPTLAELRTSARTRYEDDRVRATAALQQVTAVAGTGALNGAIGDVLEQFGRYQSLAAQAMVLGDRQGNAAGGLPPADVVVLQRKATDVLRSMLDNVRDLAGASGLDQSFADRSDTTVTARVVLMALGCLLLAMLVGLQILLRVRMRRRVNPAIAVATVLAGLLVFGGFSVLGHELDRLGSAENGSVASMRLAWQARSVSYAANADESRYLLDPGRADRYERGFGEKSRSLADVSSPTLADYDEHLAADVTRYTSDGTVLMRGLLGETLEHLGSAREKTAAATMLAAYLDYQRSDEAIRERLSAGDRRDAIELCTSDARFEEYIAALDELARINEDEFDASIADGEGALAGWTGPIPYGAGILVVALLAVGVWPRLNEYR